MKKKFTFVLLFILLFSFSFAVTVDLKTKLAEKLELSPIKVGAIYFLYKDGVTVSDFGEDYAVWLKDLKRTYNGGNWYYYELTVKISYPTAFLEKKTILEQRIEFNFSVSEPLDYEDDGFKEHLAKHFSKLNQRIQKEAYIGGREVANAIESMLESLGIVVKRNRDY